MQTKNYDDVKFEKLKIIKQIGRGLMGRAYLAHLPGSTKKYVLKISKQIDAFMKPQKGHTWKELFFYTTAAKKYTKTLTIYVIDHKIIDTCNVDKINKKVFEHPAPNDVIKNMPGKYKNIHIDLQRSPYCLYEVMPYIEGIELLDILKPIGERIVPKNKLSPPKGPLTHTGLFTKKEYYVWIIDILKQFKCIHKLGYAHNDIHPGNVMVLKNGHATLIDYGLVDSKKWSKQWSPHNDYAQLYYLMRSMNHYDEHVRINKIYGDKRYPIGYSYYLKDLAKFANTKERNIVAKLCKNIPRKKAKYIELDLAEMLFPDAMKHLRMGKYAKESVWCELWFLDVSDVIFYLEHIFQKGGIDIVIDHLSSVH